MKVADSIAASRYVWLDVASGRKASSQSAKCMPHISEDYSAHIRKELVVQS